MYMILYADKAVDLTCNYIKWIQVSGGKKHMTTVQSDHPQQFRKIAVCGTSLNLMHLIWKIVDCQFGMPKPARAWRQTALQK